MIGVEMNSIVGCDCPLCSRIRELEEILRLKQEELNEQYAYCEELKGLLDRKN